MFLWFFSLLSLAHPPPLHLPCTLSLTHTAYHHCQSKLQALPGIGEVSVERVASSPFTSYAWIITFKSSTAAGELRTLRVHRHENRLSTGTTLTAKTTRPGMAYSLKFTYLRRAESTAGAGEITAATLHGYSKGFLVDMS